VQTEVEGKLGLGLAVRAGHRYSYVETTLTDTASGSTDDRTANYSQQTGIVGMVYRHGRSVHLSLDYEKSTTNQALMRTSLLDYDQFKFDGRIELSKKLRVNGRAAFLNNRDPQSDIDFKSHNRNYSVGLGYEPCDRFTLGLEYTRSNIYSDIAILIPQSLQLDRSIFDERGHYIGGTRGVVLYRGVRLDMGYHGDLTTRSYPINYHRPSASLTIPLQKRLAFKTYWQYFGYNEKGLSLQDHRTHMVTYSLAYSR
jgi:predicted porin